MNGIFNIFYVKIRVFNLSLFYKVKKKKKEEKSIIFTFIKKNAKIKFQQ